VRVPQLRRLFNEMDPSPFHDQDLDPKADEFIVDWSRDFRRDARIALVVHLERGPGELDEAGLLRAAVRRHYVRRRDSEQARLRRLFHAGYTSLAIGTGFLLLAVLISSWVRERLPAGSVPEMLDASFVIGGWVAMWRPIEIFLYDWWPILGDKLRFARLSAMPVQIRYLGKVGGEEWRRDWPATSATRGSGAET
jgi:hypothetical protein